MTYLIVPLPRGRRFRPRRTVWSAALGFFAAVPIAYLVLVVVIQVLRPLLAWSAGAELERRRSARARANGAFRPCASWHCPAADGIVPASDGTSRPPDSEANPHMSVDEPRHLALPMLYGAPAYARPPDRGRRTLVRPFDPDDLPLQAVMTDEERALLERSGPFVQPSSSEPDDAPGPQRPPFSLRALTDRLPARGD